MTIPKIFFNEWFWLAIIAIIAVIHYFWGKTPAPPKPSKFYNKHKKTINKITDVCIICFVLVSCFLLMPFPVKQVVKALYAPQPIRATDIHFAWATFLIHIIIVSSLSGVFIGMLSFFQLNLTKIKRLILLVICLLPIAFTVLGLLMEATENPLSIIYICLQNALGSWIINAPAIFTGKHFFRVSWALLCKLRLASSDYPE